MMEHSGPDKPKYSLKLAASLTNTEATWIHELIRKGYFLPSQPAVGRGKPNLFSYNDLLKLEILKVLGKLTLLKSTAANLIKNSDLNKSGRYFCIGPASDPVELWERKIDPKPMREDYTLSFNVERLKMRLDRKLK
jgi:hypothetical protein